MSNQGFDLPFKQPLANNKPLECIDRVVTAL